MKFSGYINNDQIEMIEIEILITLIDEYTLLYRHLITIMYSIKMNRVLARHDGTHLKSQHSGDRIRQISVSLRPLGLYSEFHLGQPGLHPETLTQKLAKKNKRYTKFKDNIREGQKENVGRGTPILQTSGFQSVGPPKTIRNSRQFIL